MAAKLAFSMSITGAAEFRRKLEKLTKTESGKVIRRALRDGTKIIAAAARALVPVKSGKLKRSIKVRSGNVRVKGRYRMITITSGKDGNLFKGGVFYGGMVEFGHKVGKRTSAAINAKIDAAAARGAGRPRPILGRAARSSAAVSKPTNDARRFVQPKSFMRKAFVNTKREVERTIQMSLERGLTQAIKTGNGGADVRAGVGGSS